MSVLLATGLWGVVEFFLSLISLSLDRRKPVGSMLDPRMLVRLTAFYPR